MALSQAMVDAPFPPWRNGWWTLINHDKPWYEIGFWDMRQARTLSSKHLQRGQKKSHISALLVFVKSWTTYTKSRIWYKSTSRLSDFLAKTAKGTETKAHITSRPMRTHVDPAHPTGFERRSWPTQHPPDVCVAWQETVICKNRSILLRDNQTWQWGISNKDVNGKLHYLLTIAYPLMCTKMLMGHIHKKPDSSVKKIMVWWSNLRVGLLTNHVKSQLLNVYITMERSTIFD